MTSPVEFPIYGKFKKTELSKENLLTFWQAVFKRVDFKVRTGESVEDIGKREDGLFTVRTKVAQYLAHTVILALGRAGTPRKLGVTGEDLPKVMYRLIEADHYINKRILVVGGGDSAVEAAMGLAHQRGNQVTLSYRKESFSRIKERNVKRMEDCVRSGKVKVLFNSIPAEIKQDVVVIEVNGELQEIPNDFVWVFAGGIPPNEFLKKDRGQVRNARHYARSKPGGEAGRTGTGRTGVETRNEDRQTESDYRCSASVDRRGNAVFPAGVEFAPVRGRVLSVVGRLDTGRSAESCA
jgi:thioredoxin reductase